VYGWVSFSLAVLGCAAAVAALASQSATAAGTRDYFGTDVAILGDTLLVGAPNEGGEHGVAHVFSRNDGVWTKTLSIPAIFEASNGSTVKLNERSPSLALLKVGVKSGCSIAWARPSLKASD
jgi:hypothetical protein